MIERYVCPDGVEIRVEDCLAKCRLGDRCLTKPLLLQISYRRQQSPIASASMAGKGSRQIVLEWWQPFAIQPQREVWSLLGINTHSKAHREITGGLAEWTSAYPKEKPYLTGTLDFYDIEEKTLYDYKVWGSYKIAQILKKDPSSSFAVELQLNCYRLLLEQEGYEVDKMKIIAIPRDGGTWIAQKRQIQDAICGIEVRKIPNEEVEQYYREKTRELEKACALGEIPDYCSSLEHWGAKRCKKYCPVAEICNPPWL